MCGRFTLRTPAAAWCQLFLPEMTPEVGQKILEDAHAQGPRYNIAPTQGVAAVMRPEVGGARSLRVTRWGLVPAWADDAKIGNRMINARAETVDSKPSFRSAFKSRRCLIPADGYFEWQKQRAGKQPFLIERHDEQVFALAGLWEQNRKVGSGEKQDDGEPLLSCTVITTAANQTTATVHDRMPVIVSEADHDAWLDPGFRDTAALKAMLAPAPEDLLRMRPVSKRLNNPRHDDASCVEMLEGAE